MKINVNQIGKADGCVRKTWDEQKMDELVQSIKEQGIIVPIKVRPVKEWLDNCPRMQSKDFPMLCVELRQEVIEKHGSDGYDEGLELCPWCEYAVHGDNLFEPCPVPDGWYPYEVVYGHRRLEGARQAGLEEIDCVIEGLDDGKALLHQIIENEVREDVQPLDKANGFAQAVGAFGSIRAVADAVGIPKSTIAYYLDLLKVDKEIQKRIALPSAKGELPTGKISAHHVQESAIAGNNRVQVLDKAIKESLTAKQTRRLAEAITAAPDEKTKEELLRIEYSPHIHDPDIVALEAERQRQKKSTNVHQAEYDGLDKVKWILDYVAIWTKKLTDFRASLKAGKFSPEANQFTARRLRQLAEAILQLAGEFESHE